jgi:NAD-dependent deacetylase
MTPTSLDDQIARAGTILRATPHLAVLTGAGASAESGVPTFRDALTGLWARYDPQQLATRAAFEANPKLVWGWYQYRRELVRQAAPNPGHRALAALEARMRVTIITQNVDDLHERAGSTDIIHLHGRIAEDKCLDDCRGAPTLIEVPDRDARDGPPPCPYCGRPVRPNVVWFGEMLPPDALQRAWKVAASCATMLVIGTTGLVTPAGDLPRIAQRTGAQVIEINPDDSAITPLAHLKLDGPAGAIMPRLLAALEAGDHA